MATNIFLRTPAATLFRPFTSAQFTRRLGEGASGISANTDRPRARACDYDASPPSYNMEWDAKMIMKKYVAKGLVETSCSMGGYIWVTPAIRDELKALREKHLPPEQEAKMEEEILKKVHPVLTPGEQHCLDLSEAAERDRKSRL